MFTYLDAFINSSEQFKDYDPMYYIKTNLG